MTTMTRPATPAVLFALLLLFTWVGLGCKEDDPTPTPTNPGGGTPTPQDTTTLDNGPIQFNVLTDTYGHLANPSLTSQWAHFNVHDPAYVVTDDFVYCYNTDVAFGHDIRPGIQIRRSINLVEWEFVGWAFPGLPTLGANFIRQNGGEPFASLWAPYVLKVGNEYRLYYSLSSPTPRLSVIGLATATSPRGPFRERGLVVTSLANNTVQTNAIDPTVIVDQSGAHWMFYGSAWDGIYKLELNPTTGLAMRNEDKGVRVAQRGFTGNNVNGNIEGPEIIYNPDFDRYYMFIAYDWLQTKYNVRVGRASHPNQPFTDQTGADMNQVRDDVPMILAPYRFAGHGGWQGVSHPGVFERDGQYYIGHQGRPGVNSFYMVMHVRQLFWTEDGWPLVSCQRYAGEEETPVAESELAGTWELIRFGYQVVPGYANEQTAPGFSDATIVQLDPSGTINGDAANTWTYQAPWLRVRYAGQDWNLRVERGRDWEKNVASTVLFTGLDAQGMTAWGKKTL